MYKMLVRKSERKMPLGTPVRRYECRDKIVLEERCEGVDWIRLARECPVADDFKKPPLEPTQISYLLGAGSCLPRG